MKRILYHPVLYGFGLLLTGMLGCQLPGLGASEAQELSLEDMQRMVNAGRQRIKNTTAKLTVEEWEYCDPEPRISNHKSIWEKIQKRNKSSEKKFSPASDLETRIKTCKLNADQHQRKFYIVDRQAKRLVINTEDLRDIPALMQKYDLPDKQETNVSQSKSRLIECLQDNKFLLAWKSSHNVSIHQYDDGTVRPSSPPTTQGIPGKGFFELARRSISTIETVHKDGLELVKITFEPGAIKVIAWLHPHLGYRMHRIERYSPLGQLFMLQTASDYRIINGIPYPFSYEIKGWHHKTGKLEHRKLVKVVEAEFGTEVTDDNFKIDILAGTVVVLQPPHSQKRGYIKTRQVDTDIRADMNTLINICEGKAIPKILANKAPTNKPKSITKTKPPAKSRFSSKFVSSEENITPSAEQRKEMQAKKEELVDKAWLPKPAAGKPYVFELTDIKGKKIKSADYKGKVLILDFWATWCGPCVAELPELQELYSAYHNKGLEIIGISKDLERKDLDHYLKKKKLPWPQVFINDKDQLAALSVVTGVQGLPRYFVIDRNGNSYTDKGRGKLAEIVKKLLNN
ncbi:MAG: TlpA family protein disulfide reductase [Planctomycetota bacterium]|jgi:thiol-disulfide isomerase/thioredoxin